MIIMVICHISSVLLKVGSIRGVIRLLPITKADPIERFEQRSRVGGTSGKAHEDPSIRGPMITVMEHRDVKTVTQRIEELHQCTGTLRKLDAENAFV